MAQNLQRTIKNLPVYLESRRIRTVLADDRGYGEPHVVAHRHVLVELVAGVVEHLVLGHELDELLVHLPVEPAEFLGPVRHLRNARRGVRRLSFPATTARPPGPTQRCVVSGCGGRCEHAKLAGKTGGGGARRPATESTWAGRELLISVKHLF